MIDIKRTKLVGSFIRQRREALGLSQRALGLLFIPPVTTQFISNVERGVTPLPPAHVPTLSKALSTNDSEIMSLLEREYAVKLTERLGKNEIEGDPSLLAQGFAPGLTVNSKDLIFMKSIYDAYLKSDVKTKDAFAALCENLLHVPKNA